MNVVPLAADSLGVRSVATYVECGDTRIVIDPGASLGRSRFNLPQSIAEGLPKIGDHETMVVMHNDAVVQGLSELPYMKERTHWGALTIGTGLGNACFTNRHADKGKE